MTDEVSTVMEAGHKVRVLERQLSDAVRRRDAAVRAAVPGESLSVVAKAAGLSRQRVAQIVAAT